jgi:hypothetical protein
LWRRWRKAYSKLPPSLQLIGLQLWLPLCFICLFCFCYILAFHSPTVRNAPIAVVGSSSVVSQLKQGTGTTFAYTSADNAADADKRVIDGDAIGALNLIDPAHPTLSVASSHSYQAANIAKQAFTAIFAAQQLPLTVNDLGPLPAHDSFGMTTMYLMLSWCIGGYMVAMFIGMMGAPLRHRTRVAVIVGGAVVISSLANLLAGPVIGAVGGHFAQLWIIAIGWIVAIGLTVNGLSYYFGRFIAVPSIAIFVFLSIPSSGAAYPAFMLPRFFGWLHPYVTGFGMTEMIKRTLYGVGESYGRGLVLMACYAVVGLALMFVGKPWRQRREVRRILAGRTTMFQDAQTAMREHSIRTREKVLARYGPQAHRLAIATEGDDEMAADPVLNAGRAISGIENDT